MSKTVKIQSTGLKKKNKNKNLTKTKKTQSIGLDTGNEISRPHVLSFSNPPLKCCFIIALELKPTDSYLLMS